MLFRNDGETFTSVGKEMGIDDPRRTVGAVWFDMDQDGDLDVFIANQNGDLNGLFRNDGARFVDVAKELGHGCRRPAADLRQQRPERRRLRQRRRPRSVRRRLRRQLPVSQRRRAASSPRSPRRWASPAARWRRRRAGATIDNDGRIDLYVSSYIDKPINERDFLFHNDGGGHFTDVMPELKLAKHGATHGIQWVDFDNDGDLDFSLANNNPTRHALALPQPAAGRTGARGRCRCMVRRRQAAAPRDRARRCASSPPARAQLLGMGIVDSGGGYCSQNVMPVHIGLGAAERVDIEVTTIAGGQRQITRRAGIEPLAGVVEILRTP